MAKASSPVRIQEELMAAATAAGDLLHRSAAEQIEQWADIGRRLADVMSPRDLLQVQAGLARIKVEVIEAAPVDPDSVFDALETRRADGSLEASVGGGRMRYQASMTHPGLLERISEEGEVTVGKYVGGQFVPQES